MLLDSGKAYKCMLIVIYLFQNNILSLFGFLEQRWERVD